MSWYMISWFMPPSPCIWVIIRTRHVDMMSCHDHYAKECHNTGSRVVDAAWWYDLWPSSILETTINLLFSTSLPVMKWKCELKSNIFLTLFDRIMMRWRLHTDWMMQVSNGKKMKLKLPERIIHFNIVIGSLQVTSIVVQVHLEHIICKVC